MEPSPVMDQTPDMIAQAMTPGTGDKQGPGMIDIGAMLAKAQDEAQDESADGAKSSSDSLGDFDPLQADQKDQIMDLSPPSPLATKHNFNTKTVLERNASLESIGGLDVASAQSPRQELELQGYSPGMRVVDGF